MIDNNDNVGQVSECARINLNRATVAPLNTGEQLHFQIRAPLAQTLAYKV